MSSVKFSDSVFAKSNTQLITALLMSLLLSACGAGGGEGNESAADANVSNETPIENEVEEPTPVEVAPVQISTHPQSVTEDSGETVSFTVSASGGGTLDFQWRKNEQTIAGATSNTLTIANISEADAALYDVVITNSAGSQYSLAALLTVNTPVVVIEEPVVNPVVIVSQPQAVSVDESETASFSVEVTGDGSISYQWLKDGEVLNGANSSSLTLASVALADAANYSVIVTNSEGPVISSAASLTVNEVQVVASSIELTWDVPQAREDGSELPLYEINGYVIAYGTSQNDLTSQVAIDGASSTSTTLENLSSGTYFFSIATIDSDGVQGAYSSVIQQSI
ncbi:MAG: Ig and FN3 domain-containing protein [Oleiphilus sp.]